MLARIQLQLLRIFSPWPPILGNFQPIVNARESKSIPMNVYAGRLVLTNSLSLFRVQFRFLVNDPIMQLEVLLVVSSNPELAHFHLFVLPICAN